MPINAPASCHQSCRRAPDSWCDADLLLPIATRRADCCKESWCVVVVPKSPFPGTTTSAFRLLPVALVKWMLRQPQGQHQDEKRNETNQPGGAHNLAARPSDQAHAPLAAATPFRNSGHNPYFRRSRLGSAFRRLRASHGRSHSGCWTRYTKTLTTSPLDHRGHGPNSSDQTCKETMPSQADHCVATDW
jgi:hypothetical protein